VRKSLPSTTWERFTDIFGFFHVRCRYCDLRFKKGIFDIGNMFYTRCPRCYRLDLTTWNPDNYHIRPWWRFLMTIGARRCRCNACRHIFLSFRPKKSVRRPPIEV